MQTEELEDTLVVRSERLPGYVELCTLKAGDEFDSEFSGGRVAWSINKGYAKAVAVVFDGHTTETSIAPSLLVKPRKRTAKPPAAPIAQATPAKPTAKPVVHIVRLDDQPQAKPVNTAQLPVCHFDLELNEQQIALLHYSCLSDMFYTGLYHGWTKQTFFAVAKAKFPSNKAGQDFAACCRQINLYRSLLRRAGKLG